jgi:hypothetical protein
MIMKAIVIAAIAISFFGAAPAMASCYGKCQANRICKSLVGAKNLKGSAYDAEFEKCVKDDANYK